MAEDTPINDVSDTALWVAVYRGQETERPDALFHDPFAMKLAGPRGKQIASQMSGAKYTSWSLVIRTVVIDNYIRELLNEGVDTIVNLGAGLDARPYRLDVPPGTRWIEADFPHMINHKETQLRDDTPKCKLERVALDLTDRGARKRFLAQFNGDGPGKVLILTEGVIPYLTEQNVAELSADLIECKQIAYWIADYFSPRVLRYMKRQRKKQLKNAPFQFAPADWFGFFSRLGWRAQETRYLAEESERLKRHVPMPWWAAILRRIFGPGNPEYRRFVGYVLLTPQNSKRS